MVSTNTIISFGKGLEKYNKSFVVSLKNDPFFYTFPLVRAPREKSPPEKPVRSGGSSLARQLIVVADMITKLR